MAGNFLRSFFWKYLERSGTHIAQLAVSVVLARMLAPEDFGALVSVMAFIFIANVFAESGLRSALVQKKDANDLDFSTVFWLTQSIAVIAYSALYFCAPLIAGFYENETLASVIRVLGITLFFGALSSVQETYIQRHLLFKKLFFRSLAVVVPCGILGIALAYLGFGIWALVWQHLASAILTCVFMLFMVPWKPAFVFSAASARKLFGFGYKLLFATLCSVVSVNAINLLVGKIFSPATLGFYNRGDQFPRLVVVNVNESINAVLFPILSDAQNDIEQFKRIMARCVKTSCFVIFPLMALLASSAAPLVELVLGEKWLPCVVFLQVNCLIFAFRPFHTANMTAMNSLGRSDMFLKREVAVCVTMLLAALAAVYFFSTPHAVIISQALIIPVGCFINSYPNKKLLDYGFSEQMRDILPMLICSLIAGAAVFPISYLALPNSATVVLQGVLGLSVYLLLAKALRLESLDYLTDVLKTSRSGK